jgi:16S rRNA (guanine(966)-N(2))-methyltransferase RsmD
MRIISGRLKGRKLFTPKNLDIRPATDRVRQYIFDCLREYVFDAEILDLFAGTGSVGIEALSRGAKSAIFVDNSQQAISLLHKNIETLNLKENSTISKMDALRFLEKHNKQHNLIFLDPPYRYSLTKELSEKIASLKILKPDGFLIIEHDDEAIISELLSFKLLKQKKFGRTIISILTLK